MLRTLTPFISRTSNLSLENTSPPQGAASSARDFGARSILASDSPSNSDFDEAEGYRWPSNEVQVRGVCTRACAGVRGVGVAPGGVCDAGGCW
ncbi:hypothetical protein V6Z12_A10G156700 [Gossypium hirsutum]